MRKFANDTIVFQLKTFKYFVVVSQMRYLNIMCQNIGRPSIFGAKINNDRLKRISNVFFLKMFVN